MKNGLHSKLRGKRGRIIPQTHKQTAKRRNKAMEKNYWRDYPDDMEISIDDFEQIYKLNFDFLFRVVHRIINDQDEALNLVHDTFLTFLKKRDVYFPEQKAGIFHIGCWLRKTARNKSLCYLNRKKMMWLKYRQVFSENPRVEITDLFGNYHAKPESDVAQEFEQREKVATVRKAVKSLPKHMMAVVLMKRWKFKSIPSIAESLNVSKHYVRNWLYESQSILQNALMHWI